MTTHKVKPPLKEAIKLTTKAIKIVRKYKYDKHFIPTQADIRRFSLLVYMFKLRYYIARNIYDVMRARRRQEIADEEQEHQSRK